MQLITMVKVKQHFPSCKIDDVEKEVVLQLGRLKRFIHKDMTIAITAGSRGINNISLILKTIVNVLKSMGANPFIVSAMGSHGEGTVRGQKFILEQLGITESSVNAPLRITDKAVEIDTTSNGHILYTDAEAFKADGILVVNRIKPHTAFEGKIGSGLFKMMTVGLGKIPGATQVHKLGFTGMYPAIIDMGRLALKKLNIIGGLAIIENGYEETKKIELIMPQEMEEKEQQLYSIAAGLLPRLPVKKLDLLIVDEMGKNFSGTGMDTNVIGRWKIPNFNEPDYYSIKRIVVLDLSNASGGNANGIGLADFTTSRLVYKIDWNATLTNIQTTGFWSRAFCPPFFKTDLETVRWAIRSLGLPHGSQISAVRIRNTLHLDKLWLTPNILQIATNCEQIGDPKPVAFNNDGRINNH
jgi:hypothetical protein